MQNWDDLRIFLAVAKTGTLTAAAETLHVNQSTVSRRINSFEKDLNVRLFERLSTGYELTAEGEEVLQRAQRIEEETHSIDRQVMNKNVALSGPIRMTCSLVIARYFIIPLLKRFHTIHPDIVVHLDLSNNLYNLTTREADVAVRVTSDAIPETLIGRELGQIDYSVYAESNYLKAYRQHQDDVPLHWVGEDNHDERPKWLPKDFSQLALSMRSNDVLATLDIVKQGLGVGRLPNFIGEAEPSLQRMDFQHPVQAKSIWLLTHADMRRVNRISVFNHFIVSELRQQLGYQSKR